MKRNKPIPTAITVLSLLMEFIAHLLFGIFRNVLLSPEACLAQGFKSFVYVGFILEVERFCIPLKRKLRIYLHDFCGGRVSFLLTAHHTIYCSQLNVDKQ